MRFIIKWILVAVSLLVAEYFIDGITIDNFWPTAILATLVLELLNTIVKPIIKLFALPITIVTLGLFGLLINVGVFWLLTFVPGITIDSFSAALWGAIIVSICGMIIDFFTKEKK